MTLDEEQLWKRLVGIPFVDGGRDILGADCYGLVVLYYKLAHDITIPDYNESYKSKADYAKIDAAVRAGRAADWVEVEKPEPGDVCAAWVVSRDILSHVLIKGPGRDDVLSTVSHVEDGREIGSSRLEPMREWERRLSGSWLRHRSLCRSLVPATPASVLAEPGEFIVVWSRSPFEHTPLTMGCEVGRSIFEVVKALGIRGAEDMRVYLNDWDVPIRYWKRVRPKQGAVLRVCPLVGADPAAIWQTITSFFKGVASGLTGGTAFAGSSYGLTGFPATAFSLGGQIGSGLLHAGISFGLQQVATSVAGIGGDSDTPSIGSSKQTRVGGGGNEIRRFEAWPVGFGHTRPFPPLATQPVFELAGNQLFVRAVYLVGEGRYDLDVNTIEINDVPWSNYQLDEPGAFAQVRRSGMLPDPASPYTVVYASEVQDSEGDVDDSPDHYWMMQDAGSQVDEEGGPSLVAGGGVSTQEDGLLAGEATFSVELDGVDGRLSAGSMAWSFGDQWSIDLVIDMNDAFTATFGVGAALFHVGNDDDGFAIVLTNQWPGGLAKPAWPTLHVWSGGGPATVYGAGSFHSAFIHSALAGNVPERHICVKGVGSWAGSPPVWTGTVQVFAGGAEVIKWLNVTMPAPADFFTLGALRNLGGTFNNFLGSRFEQVAVRENVALSDSEILWRAQLAEEGLPADNTRGAEIRLFNVSVQPGVITAASNLVTPTYDAASGDWDEPLTSGWISVDIPGDSNEELRMIFEFPSGLFVQTENSTIAGAVVVQCLYQPVDHDPDEDEQWSPFPEPEGAAFGAGTQVGAWFIDPTTIYPDGANADFWAGPLGRPSNLKTNGEFNFRHGGFSTVWQIPDGAALFQGIIRTPFFSEFVKRVPAGEYRVRWRAMWNALWTSNAEASVVDGGLVGVAPVRLRAAQGATPDRQIVVPPNAALLGMRVPSEDHGRVSIECKRMVRVYDAAYPGIRDDYYPSWPMRFTRRAPWLALSVLMETGPRPKNAESGSPPVNTQINLQEFIDWDATLSIAGGPEPSPLYNDGGSPPRGDGNVDVYVDWQADTWGLFNYIAGFAKASLDYPDGKFGVVEDKLHPTPIGVLTPRNTKGIRGKIDLSPKVHAAYVRFFDEDENWEKNEIIVYDDGYSELGEVSGTSPATIFRNIEINGITNKQSVANYVRHRLRAARLRAESWEIEGYIDTIGFRRGERVEVAHPAALVGQIQARITDVTIGGGGAATAVEIEVNQTFVNGTLYGCRFWRSPDARVVSADVDNPSVGPDVVTKSINFATPVPAADIPAEGDLIAVGVRNLETLPCILQSILPQPNVVGTILKLYAYDTAVLDLSEDARFKETGLTPIVDINVPRGPRPPDIDEIISGLDQAFYRNGTFVYQDMHVVVSYTPATGFPRPRRIPADFVQARFRTKGIPTWEVTPPVATAAGTIVCEGVTEGSTQEVQVRGLKQGTVPGNWGTRVEHVVEGRSAPPPTPINVRIEDRVILWDYPAPPVDLLGFEVRFLRGNTGGQGWEEGARPRFLPHQRGGFTTSNEFRIKLIRNHTFTVLVKAIDDTLNESADPGFVVVNLGDPAFQNIVETVSYAALGWPGTKVGCYRNPISGNLQCVQAGSDLDRFFGSQLYETNADGTLSDELNDSIFVNFRRASGPRSSVGVVKDGTSGAEVYIRRTDAYSPALDLETPTGAIGRLYYYAPTSAHSVLATTGALLVRLGSGPSDYYEWSFDKADLVADEWSELIGIDFASEDTTTGSPPAKTAITWAEVVIVCTAAGSTFADPFKLCGLRIVDPTEDGNIFGFYEASYVPTDLHKGSALRVDIDGIPNDGAMHVEYRPPTVDLMWDPDDNVLMWDRDKDGDVDVDDQNALMWSAADDWQLFPGEILDVERQNYKFRVVFPANTRGAKTTTKMTKFDVIVDVPDLVEELKNVPIGPDDSKVFFTKVFRDAPFVTVAMQRFGDDDATHVQVIETTSGWVILRATDWAGDPGTAHVNISARGVPSPFPGLALLRRRRSLQ